MSAAAVLQHLRRRFSLAAGDGELLHAYSAGHDHEAFRGLVERHGPLVLAICRRRLGDVHAAEDAFQATFLILARHAGAIRRPEALAGWLARTAARVCFRARAVAARRRTAEAAIRPRVSADPAAELTARELLTTLDEELDRLPQRYRLPLWLSYWQGVSHADAAKRLGLSAGAFHGRLDRGRRRLAERLRRRGFAPGELRPLLVTAGGATAVPSALLARTVELAAAPWSPAIPAAVLAMTVGTSKYVPLAALLALLTGVGGLALTAGSGSPADAPKAAPANRPADLPSFTGTIHFRGMPVAGASVWLRIYTNAGDTESGPATTDAQGRFAVPVPESNSSRRFALVARDAAGRIGWRDFYGGGPDTDANFAMRLELHEVGEARGRILDGSGRPVGGAKVAAEHLQNPSLDADAGLSFDIPKLIRSHFATVSAADGAFAIPGIPAGTKLQASISAPGYGRIAATWSQVKACELRLEAAGRLHVRFRGAADPKALAGLKLYLYGGGDSGVAVSEELTAGLTDSLTASEVPPGRYKLEVAAGAVQVPYVYTGPTLEVTIPSGGEAESVVDLQPAAQVRGRLVNKATGAGIAGVQLWLQRMSGDRRGSIDTVVTTDADGRFSAYVSPGRRGLSLPSRSTTDFVVPAGHELVKPVEAVAGASSTFPDVALEPTVSVSGDVIDARGRPVAGVRVWSAHLEQLEMPLVRTDAEGRFTIPGLGADEPTALRARTPKAVTDGAVAVPAGPHKEAVRLTLKESTAFRLRGAAVDAAGKPLADAQVGVQWMYAGVGRSATFFFPTSIETVRTDADGRFESHALWPGDRYRVNVSADGFGRAESAQVTGVAGQVHDLGQIALTRMGGAVAGRVIDGADRPLSGVRVINSGDAPKRLAATTDDEGRFRLTGFFDGPVHLVAQRQGYRLTLLPTRAGESAVVIRMLKADGPPPAWPGIASAATNEADVRKLIRETLDKLWRLPRNVTKGYETNVLESMFRFDPQTARRWLAEERQRGNKATVARGQQLTRMAEAESAAAGDAEDAIAKLEPLPPGPAFDLLMKLARRSRKEGPVKAQRLLEEAVVRGRAFGLPERCWRLTDAVELADKLGQTDSARKLIAETATLAESLATDGMHGYARGRVAAVLAVYDLPRAKKLVEPIAEANERERWTASMAVHLAPHDLSKAQDLLKPLRSDQYSTHARTHMLMAIRLAAAQPAEAVRQLEAISDPNYKTRYQVAGLAAVAVEVAQRDPALGRKLIDRALARLLERQEDLRSWSNYGGAGGLAAWIAHQARRADHPDMDAVIAHVWAMAPVGPDSPAYLHDQVYHVVTTLALTDPAAAKALLERALPAGRPVDAAAVDRREALFALALADPERAAQFIDARIDAAQKSKDGLQGTGLIELVHTLAEPPGEERTRLLGRYVTTYNDLIDED